MSIAHWRKEDNTEQKLCEHLSGVSEKANVFAGKIGLDKAGQLMGLVHDLGKYGNLFQNYIKSGVGLIDPDEDDFVDYHRKRGKIDHSTAGAKLVWRELTKKGQLGIITGQMLALCLASHHSGLINCIGAGQDDFGEDLFSRRMNKKEDRVFLEEALLVADKKITSAFWQLINSPDLIQSVKEAFAKIIKKQPKNDDKSQLANFHHSLLVRFLFSALIDADRLDTADFEKPKAALFRQQGRYEDWPILIDRLETHLRQFRIRDPVDNLRRDISGNCLRAANRVQGIYTLTVPTGGGKTLSSLRFALHHAKEHEMERIIYIIPYTSIIDQNADVVRSVLERSNSNQDAGKIVLEHHSNLTPEKQGWKEKILSENWDAPVIFTTMVQLLETLFGSGTRGARRMHQLANAVLIFDEIQTLPVRCIHLFNNAMNFLVEQCGSSVLLCTATQPLLHQVDREKGAIHLNKDGSEIMPDLGDLFDHLKRVEVKDCRKAGGWTHKEIAELSTQEVRKSRSCLIIVNTKKQARYLFNELNQWESEFFVCHLSTSMCPSHRRHVLSKVRECLDVGQPLICVSTQLIEAGVDVDFGAVIRFMAGLDSIAQAAGRCNRNGLRKRGLVYVINPSDENLEMLPDIFIGKEKTERIFDDFKTSPEKFRHDILGPEAMSWYYENYFFRRREEMAYPVRREKIGHDDSLLNLLFTNSLAVTEYSRKNNTKPGLYLRQAFSTASNAFQAIDAPTQGVIVPYGETGRQVIADLCAAFQLDKQFDLLRRAQQFSVNVFPNVMKSLLEQGVLYPVQEGTNILYLNDRYYSDTFGLSQEPVTEGRDYFA